MVPIWYNLSPSGVSTYFSADKSEGAHLTLSTSLISSSPLPSATADTTHL